MDWERDVTAIVRVDGPLWFSKTDERSFTRVSPDLAQMTANSMANLVVIFGSNRLVASVAYRSKLLSKIDCS